MDGSTRVAAPAARLDQYLAERLPTLSRSQVQRLISEHVSRGAAVILTTHLEAGITAAATLRIDLEAS